jgi:hypothetical protein
MIVWRHVTQWVRYVPHERPRQQDGEWKHTCPDLWPWRCKRGSSNMEK